MAIEKLIRLLQAGHDYYYSDQYHGANVYEAIAKYLIANGVTIPERRKECLEMHADMEGKTNARE